MTHKKHSVKKVVKKREIGNDPIGRLYKAVIKYIESNGGTAVVIGGIALVEDSPLKYNYGIMVRVTGKKPVFPSLPTKK